MSNFQNNKYAIDNDHQMNLVELGEQLRLLREAQNMTYDDIANLTHMRPYIVKSIEEGRIDEVAAPIYVRGFVKTYCEFLHANDLWKKYSSVLPTADAPKTSSRYEASVDISPPTPMFRRSSIIWVYVVLLLAVAGAGFLLWNQHKNPDQSPITYFLRTNDTATSSETNDTGGGTPDALSHESTAALSGDLPQPLTELPGSGDVALSRDLAGASADMVARPPDLSWMNDGAVASPDNSQAAVDNRVLFIRINSPCRLMVKASGQYITRRNLVAGEYRQYDVSSDVNIHLSVGRAADIIWQGVEYERAGSDGKPVAIDFLPDGRARVVEGNSEHFQ